MFASVCKWVFLIVSGALALLGMFFCGVVACALLSQPQGGTSCCVGPEACAESTAANFLPLPEQKEDEFPMALDSRGMCDYSGFVIFRASPEWQAAFCAYYARHPQSPHNTSELAQKLAERTPDTRIRAFIERHRWVPFHDCCVWELGSTFRDCTALRDESGEYVLLYYRTF